MVSLVALSIVAMPFLLRYNLDIVKKNKTFRLSPVAIADIIEASKLSGMTQVSFLERSVARSALEWRLLKNRFGSVKHMLGLFRASGLMHKSILDGHPVKRWDALTVDLLREADGFSSSLVHDEAKLDIPPLSVRQRDYNEMLERLHHAIGVRLGSGKWEVEES